MFDKRMIEKLVEYQRKAKSGYWPCLNPKCNSRAINSHIVQKNRYLKNVATEDSKVFVHETSAFNGPFIIFKERGLNQVLSFPGFCKKHDDSLFKSIEKKEIDFQDWRSIHLLCYRTELNERRKKQIAIKTLENVINDRAIIRQSHPNQINNLKSLIYGNSLGLKDSNKTILDIIQDLNSNNSLHFGHYVRELVHTGLCVCGVFNLETSADQYYHQRISGKEYDICLQFLFT